MIYDTGWAGTDHSFRNLEAVVRRTTKDLRQHLDEFDSIVVTGVSGLVVGAPVALRLKKPLVVVRKSTDGSHSTQLVEGKRDIGKRVLFLDDFVSSGKSQAAVREALHEETHARIVFNYQYKWRSIHLGPDADERATQHLRAHDPDAQPLVGWMGVEDELPLSEDELYEIPF